jgi:nucleotide-binding universal stress UspA family protein
MQPVIEHIFHPTDLSDAGRPAFAHALALAVRSKARLTLLHASEAEEASLSGFPGVRDTLVQWGLLQPGARRDSLTELGIGVRKVAAGGQDPVDACMEYLEHHPADLIVMASGQHAAAARWMGASVSEPLARKARTAVLFVPHGCRGIVDAASGCTRLQRILIPVAIDPSPHAALAWSAAFGATLGAAGAEREHIAYHAGKSMPSFDPALKMGARFTELTEDSDIVEGILGAAHRMSADLVVMQTMGHDGMADKLLGSRSERILRRLHVPLLMLPS